MNIRTIECCWECYRFWGSFEVGQNVVCIMILDVYQPLLSVKVYSFVGNFTLNSVTLRLMNLNTLSLDCGAVLGDYGTWKTRIVGGGRYLSSSPWEFVDPCHFLLTLSACCVWLRCGLSDFYSWWHAFYTFSNRKSTRTLIKNNLFLKLFFIMIFCHSYKK